MARTLSSGRRLRDTFIAFVSRLGIAYLYRTYRKRSGPLVRVLVFHDVTDLEWFKSLIAFITARYHVITPADFLDSRFDRKRINVLLTFDDGYESWLRIVMPILAKYHITGLFFVCSGLLDRSGDPAAIEEFVHDHLLLHKSHKTLSWEGLQTLIVAGHMVGGHTKNHSRLARLPESAQREEVMNDKVRIELVLGKPIEAFAYPFGNRGDQMETSVRIVRNGHFTRAFTTEGTFVHHDEPYRVARLCVEDEQSAASLGRSIEGGYDLYQKLKIF